LLVKLTRREWLGGAAVFGVAHEFKLTAASRIAGAASTKAKATPITPERFGARGDGRTNDTAAFAKMAAYVNRLGGGQVVLRPTTYIVGQQSTVSGSIYAYAPAPIMDFIGCSRPLAIQGNGARLRCANGLRFGTFDPSTGLPTTHSLPYYGTEELAAPYIAMIQVANCTGDVNIEDVELDGNLAGLQIGGPYGDTGWQINGCGLRLTNNVGGERIARLRSHHHPLDGIIIDGAAARDTASVLEDVVCEYNARQGCSVVGGHDYSFVNCKFLHTGRAGLASAPGAGVDIEAESNAIRNLSFTGCEFSNNVGCGLVADSGDSEDATFQGCRFIGTTAWAAWPRMPRFRFASCEFVGSICNAFGDADPDRAAQFHDCVFHDDPALSPTGEVYSPANPIADLSSNQNVLFDGCTFQLVQELVLPWSLYAIYNDCAMSQVSTTQAYPRGTFIGVNRIDGNVDLYGSTILGELTLNGQVLTPTA
jgi:hypothetical protein